MFRDLFDRHELWHISRTSIARATAIGLFCSMVPLPGQMIVAVFVAIRVGANVPLGTGNANALAGGISEARLTTAAGLIVAITALVMHRYYTGLIDTIVVHLEREAIKLVDAIHNGAGQDYTT